MTQVAIPQTNEDASLVVVGIDENGDFIFGRPPGAVHGPQSSEDVGQFVTGIDDEGNLTYGTVQEEYIDSSNLTGWRATSSSLFNIGFGVQYVVMDYDDERLRPGSILLGRVPRQDFWAWGLVLAKDYTVEPCRVKFATLVHSKDTADGFSEVWWQLKSGPLMGFSPDATIGISGDEITIPSLGQTVTANILEGKLVSRNVSILFSDATNLEGNYFRLIVDDYDEVTGDVEGRCTAFNGTGTADAWIVSLIPGPPSGSAPQPSSITLFASATSQATTIVAPASIQAGDIIVLHDYMHSIAGSARVVPIGFTEIKSVNKSDVGINATLSAKLADGTEGGTTITGSARDSQGVKILAVFRPDVPAIGFTIGSPVGEMTDGNPSSKVVTASGASGATIVLGAFTTFKNPAAGITESFSPAATGSIQRLETGGGTAACAELHYKLYGSSPADVTIDMGDETNDNGVLGGYIEIFGRSVSIGDAIVAEDLGDGVTATLPAMDGSQLTDVVVDPASGILNHAYSNGSVSAAATCPIALPTKADGTYCNFYEIDFSFMPATDNVDLYVRTDSGSTAGDSGASDYDYATVRHTSAATGYAGSTAVAQMVPILAVGNVAGEGGMLNIKVAEPNNSGKMTKVSWTGDYMVASDGSHRVIEGAGRRKTALADTHVVLQMSSGNITGVWSCRGHD